MVSAGLRPLGFGQARRSYARGGRQNPVFFRASPIKASPIPSSFLTKEISCVLLAEPHHALAEGTRLLLGTLFDAVVMVADESSLLETAGRVRPGLLMVDLILAKKNVAGLISRLREISPGSKVIVVSVHDEPAVARAILESGADGFLVKCRIGCELIPAVEAVLRGERYISSRSRRD